MKTNKSTQDLKLKISPLRTQKKIKMMKLSTKKGIKSKRLVLKSVRTLSLRAATRQPARPPMSRNKNVWKRISPLLPLDS